MCNGCSVISSAACTVQCGLYKFAKSFLCMCIVCLFVVRAMCIWVWSNCCVPDEKEKNNKINKEETLFPDKKIIPPGLNSEKCSCGYTFNSVALESRHPIIHHSKPTKDSRNSSELSIHFLKTSHCDCKSYYYDENERLVRTSSAPSTKQNSSVHFVWVDCWKEKVKTTMKP